LERKPTDPSSGSRASEEGVCRGSDTPNYLRGDIDMHIPPRKS